jgi:hypothetical protein
MPFERLVSALRNVRELCAEDPHRVLKQAMSLRLAGRLAAFKLDYDASLTDRPTQNHRTPVEPHAHPISETP